MERPIFSLEQANDLLPTVRQRTADAVRDAEAIAERLRGIEEHDPRHQQVNAELNDVVARWAAAMQALRLEVKGLWLVDFDNGEGYYCWRYPEERVVHYHGYTEGFAGRMKIV